MAKYGNVGPKPITGSGQRQEAIDHTTGYDFTLTKKSSHVWICVESGNDIVFAVGTAAAGFTTTTGRFLRGDDADGIWVSVPPGTVAVGVRAASAASTSTVRIHEDGK